jgi:hypothetical protein
MEQFTSNDISVPLTSAKSGKSAESMDRNKKTP